MSINTIYSINNRLTEKFGRNQKYRLYTDDIAVKGGGGGGGGGGGLYIANSFQFLQLFFLI